MTARAWTLFVLSSVIWGVPYLFIKVAVDAGVPPAFVAWSRIVLAAALLLPLAIRRKALRGLRDRAGAIFGYTASEVAVPFVLISIGEQYITSSLTAILVATMPLMVALLSLQLMPGEHLSGKRLLGLLIGFGGVVALLGFDVAGRRLADLDPLGPVTASLLIATVALLPPAIATFPSQLPSVSALIAFAVLGIICTAAGLIVFF